MNLAVLVASAILLQPVFDEATEVRLAASGTDGHEVQWYLDGVLIASTQSGQATTALVPEGAFDLWATTEYDGTWRAIARPTDATGAPGVEYVQAWSGVHEKEPRGAPFVWPMVAILIGGALLVVAGRRPKRP